ncbi:hypothetical protein PV04_05932 [Phialophora macrospora]|uniref:Uncharacterized protein n=1 Tax=Phialophora macrospora TaxID=1851006 RepID=A0A0D2FIN3_9EURO|nr:hypothetical protein PV04_05932 [Phialophora macrospora]
MPRKPPPRINEWTTSVWRLLSIASALARDSSDLRRSASTAVVPNAAFPPAEPFTAPQPPERTYSDDVADESDAVESLTLTSERMLAGREEAAEDEAPVLVLTRMRGNMPSSSGVGAGGALLVRRERSVERMTLAERARNHQPCFFGLGAISVAVAALEGGHEEDLAV